MDAVLATKPAGPGSCNGEQHRGTSDVHRCLFLIIVVGYGSLIISLPPCSLEDSKNIFDH